MTKSIPRRGDDIGKYSRTETETSLTEALTNLGSHYKATIWDDNDRRVEGYGSTAEESEEAASDRWDGRYEDDD